MKSSAPNPAGPAFDFHAMLEFLGQFEAVRSHLVRAGGEMLLACKALLDSALESLEREMPGNRQRFEFLYALQYALGLVSARVPQPASNRAVLDEELRRQKVVALQSILSVIQAEIEGVGAGHKTDLNESEQIRLAAMRAIENVLRREMEKAQPETGKSKRASAQTGKRKRPTRSKSEPRA